MSRINNNIVSGAKKYVAPKVRFALVEGGVICTSNVEPASVFSLGGKMEEEDM